MKRESIVSGSGLKKFAKILSKNKQTYYGCTDSMYDESLNII